MHNGSNFRWQPLGSQGAIRLLTIRSSDHSNNPLECDLHHISSLNEAGEYTALSYAWGSLTADHVVMVDGALHFVNQNTQDALCSVLDHRQKPTVWIDALCINQDDTDERSHQVLHMRDIYLHAHETIVWLGPSTEESDLALKFLPTLYSTWAETQQAEYPTDLEWYRSVGTGHEYPRDVWMAVRNIFAREWFRRLWVIQELILSRTVYFICGARQVLSEELKLGVYALSLGIANELVPPGQTADSSPPHMGFTRILHVQEQWKTPEEGLPFSRLCYHCSHALTTDPRDRVYGLLGLMDPVMMQLLRPDYRKSVQQVYMDAVAASMFSEYSCDVISLASVRPPEQLLTWPSWVPDFRAGVTMTLFSFWHETLESEDPGVRTTIDKLFNFAFEEDRLILFGSFIDEVSMVSSLHVLQHEDVQRQRGNMITRWVQDVFQMVEQQNSAPNPTWMQRFMSMLGYSGPVPPRWTHEHIWRTLIANRSSPSTVASPEYVEKWKIFHQELVRQVAFHDKKWHEIDKLLTETNLDRDQASSAVEVMRNVVHASGNRRFCITEKQATGLVPGRTRKGDVICLVQGAKAPLVLRKSLGTDVQGHSLAAYEFVGDCYLYDETTLLSLQGRSTDKDERIVLV